MVLRAVKNCFWKIQKQNPFWETLDRWLSWWKVFMRTIILVSLYAVQCGHVFFVWSFSAPEWTVSRFKIIRTILHTFIKCFSNPQTTQSTLQHLSHSTIHTLIAEVAQQGVCLRNISMLSHSHTYTHTHTHTHTHTNWIASWSNSVSFCIQC